MHAYTKKLFKNLNEMKKMTMIMMSHKAYAQREEIIKLMMF